MKPTVVLFALLTGVGLVRADFTSLYVFGDGLCTTTNNASPASFCGQRYCNGRVWVEHLAEWQGLSYDSNKNWSYYGHTSDDLVQNLEAFVPPADVATSLFVVWAANADFVIQVFADPLPFDPPSWAAFIEQSLSNHGAAVTNLHAKGVRTLIMLNASDVSPAPALFLSGSDAAFVRAQAQTFNQGFNLLASNLVATLPGLTLLVPDSFALFDDILDNPVSYGVTNTDSYALADHPAGGLEGPGAEYVFWDDQHVTARVQMHLAEFVQDQLSPVRIRSIADAGNAHQLGVTSIPVGRTGEVQATTNLVQWSVVQALGASNTSEVVVVPAAGSTRFYRLYFPIDYSAGGCP